MAQDATLHVKLDRETDARLKQLAEARGEEQGPACPRGYFGLLPGLAVGSSATAEAGARSLPGWLHQPSGNSRERWVSTYCRSGPGSLSRESHSITLTGTRTQCVPEQTRWYFFDTATLSNFALSGCLDLLIERYGQTSQITPQVLDEVVEGIVAGYTSLQKIEEAVTGGKLGSGGTLSVEERRTYRKLLRALSPGEASCISCATIQGGIVATDDTIARRCCTERGVEFTGTIGILKACALDGSISSQEADRILKAMIDAGYYSPVSRISSLL